jgi:chromosome segregation ATPase
MGNAVYNLTERALIEEIRKDTAEKIAAKEMEMAAVISRLDEVDDELSKLYSNNQNLSVEQITAQGKLLAMQNSFRDELAVLQDERSQILEASHSKEARLRAQLDERTREFAAAQQKVSGELDFAVSELDRLTTEQEKIAAIDAQVSGGFASVKDFIQKGQYDQALGTVENLRRFCNNNTLASSRVFQSRKDFYNQSVDFVEAMIVDARKNSGSSPGLESEQFELAAKNVQLQNNISEMQKTIDALSSGGSGLNRRVSELEASVSSLQKGSSEKDDKISSLETEKTNSTAEITRLRNANTAQEQEISRLRNQVGIAQQALQALQALQE